MRTEPSCWIISNFARKYIHNALYVTNQRKGVSFLMNKLTREKHQAKYNGQEMMEYVANAKF